MTLLNLGSTLKMKLRGDSDTKFDPFSSSPVP